MKRSPGKLSFIAMFTLTSGLCIFLFNNCSTGRPGSTNITVIGNPMTATSKVLTSTCKLLTTCNSFLAADVCENGVKTAPGIGEALGLPTGVYNSFLDVMASESAGLIYGNNQALSVCDSAIQQLPCSSPVVMAAYQADASQPFGLVQGIYSAAPGSCRGVFANLYQSVASNAGYPPTANLLTLTLPSVGIAGDLILVSVGWDLNSVTVTSITDSQGNVYQSGLGPTGWGTTFHEQIFYAKNIFGGANVINIQMSGSSSVFFEARAFEYTGVDSISPIDAISTSTGFGTSMNSGSVGVASVGEILFAVGQSDTVSAVFTPLSGFSLRPINSGGGIIVEDKVAIAAVPTSASATASVSGNWIMQLISIRRK